MFEIILLVLSVSIDSFIASISYGTNKIKIPLFSALIIDIISTFMLGFSLILGDILNNFISISFAKYTSFFLLLALGLYRLFESILKSYINIKFKNSTPLKFKFLDFNFVIEVYGTEIKADFDNSKNLSPKEAIYLALALSFDSLAVGFSTSLISINYSIVIILSLTLGFILIILGSKIGEKLILCSDKNYSWISGFMLILLSFLRFF